MTIQCGPKTMEQTLKETLTALCNKFITGLAIYGIGMSLAYAGYIGQEYDTQHDWCDPRFCCPPERLDESK